MKKIENMFTIPLVHIKCADWGFKKSKLLMIPENLEKVDFVETDYHKKRTSYNQKIETILNDEIEIFLNLIGQRYCKIVFSWFENSKNGNHHSVHSHGPKGFSGVCYVNYNKDFHKPLHFIAPFRDFVKADDICYIPDDVEESSILFFPSSILHYTLPNESMEERLILSFNIEFLN